MEPPLELGRRLLAVEERLDVLEEDPLDRPLPVRGALEEADDVLDLSFSFFCVEVSSRRGREKETGKSLFSGPGDGDER